MRTRAASKCFAARNMRIALLFAVMLAGCTQFRPFIPTSEGHIDSRQAKADPSKDIPPPVRVAPFVPPPKPAAPPQTYSVVVNEVPVKELLLALARDTKQNIDIHPGIAGLVSLNAINETLPAILDRVSKQVSIRYRTEGNTIVVSPDVPYSATYRVDHVNIIRNASSTIAVSGQITGSTTSGGSGGAAGGVGGSAGAGTQSASSSAVTTTSAHDFWKMLETTVRGILTSSLRLSAQERAERLSMAQVEQRIRLEEAVAARITADKQSAPGIGSNQGRFPGATPLQAAAASAGLQQATTGQNVVDDVIVNPIAGTLTITATETQHKLIQDFLVQLQQSVQRQVLIEATIVEVQLSNNYQAGIDWARVSQSGGIAFSQALLGGNLATAPFFALFYNQNNQRPNDIQLTVRLLEQFGNTRVLSSPKLMALNNQTALLKVVDNVVYFEVRSQTSQAQTSAVTTFDTTARTVAVGVVMGVTPQVGEDDRVSLTVRPTISRVVRFVNDPNPALAQAGVVNAVPQVQTREMESVLQLGNGQTVVLGGLMQDDVQRTRDQVPFIGNVPNLGDLFAFRNENVTKSELVIFLKATVVKNPTLNSDELKAFQRFLPQPETPPDVSSVPPSFRAPDLQSTNNPSVRQQ